MAAAALLTIQQTGGRTVTLRTWASTYDPQTGVSSRTKTDTIVSSSPLLPFGGGRTTRSADIAARVTGTLYIPSAGTSGVVPVEGSQVAIGADEYTILAVATYEVETTKVLYECQLAKGGAVIP